MLSLGRRWQEGRISFVAVWDQGTGCLLGEFPNKGSVLLCWDQGQLCCGLNKTQLMEELAEESRTVCECTARRAEEGMLKNSCKRLCRCDGFYQDMRQDRAEGCCAGAVLLRGREGVGNKETRAFGGEAQE